ncbi:U4/U6.U5 tri-snRNP-associated protein 1 [Scyliorhinus canicula]|uniref:U4/U6.U5 tri-snRNP-associated protein 1 n=1 Tax=Scyliorhinus canicula TaxID=7830 RepID=UPI0018F41A7A|nr:U4/U6.U5 tri-snRNP-associated protein 1 [Scyliorhinus canicula]
MGSSKKHRERDRGADDSGRHKKHKHKERKQRAASREREGRRHRERERRTAPGDAPPERRIKREKSEDAAAGGKSGAASASLSIEETNKLRAKLGLKPLEVQESKKAEIGTKEDPVLVPAINPIAAKQQEDIRVKLAALKEKRLLNQKLGKVKSLGDDDAWLDDAMAWVEKSRKLQREKEMAEKRAKLLEEMDEEFGISNLIEEELQTQRQTAYTSRDLKGLTVQHDIEAFKEGEAVVLTLKDKGVLDEEDDILVNVNILDKERANKNVELKKKKPDYKPYEEEESIDDMAVCKAKTILSKYDEEIDGEKKKSFRLEAGGIADGSWERELQQIRENLRNEAQTLEMPQMKLASEFYTEEEMVTFKKTKRRVKKIRKKEMALKADDLLTQGHESTVKDYGSRDRGRGWKSNSGAGAEGDAEQGEAAAPEVQSTSDDVRVESMDISDDEARAPDSPVAIEEDEAEMELQKQLQKQRRLRQMNRQPTDKVVDIAKKLKSERKDEDADELERKGLIVFNATSEFCRTLGEIPTYGLAGNREEQEELLDFEVENKELSDDEMEMDRDETVGWSTVNLDEEKKQPEFLAMSTTILDEEPIVNCGLAAALHLCRNKGLLDTTMQKVARVRSSVKTLPSTVYAIEDKMLIDDKYSRREEYRGFTQEFKEKEAYRPDVKIDYVDESGRRLTPKEAFRQLSHRFHGKGSGKMKTEKRMKKLEEEHLLRKMSSSDTPLGTVALLQEKQKAQKTPYIVLSGSGKSMNVNTITK